MALPWLIGGAVALGAAAIAAALSDDDDKPSNNKNDDDDDGERRRRERAERERTERERGEKRSLLVSSANTQVQEAHSNALSTMKEWISDTPFKNSLTMSSSGSNLVNLYDNSLSFPLYPTLIESEKSSLHLLQGLSGGALQPTKEWLELSSEIQALESELKTLNAQIQLLRD